MKQCVRLLDKLDNGLDVLSPDFDRSDVCDRASHGHPSNIQRLKRSILPWQSANDVDDVLEAAELHKGQI